MILYLEEVATPSDAIVFDDYSDSRLYTVTTHDPVTTVQGQVVTYLLDIRNILLIFLLIWFVTNFFARFKNTVLRFFRG